MTTRGKKVALVLFGSLVICVLAALSLKVINDRHRALARQIQVGDSMAKVRRLLGSPTATYSGFLGYPSWGYGSRLDFDSGFPRVRFRFLGLGPDSHALAFYFDASSNVVHIQIPSR